MMDAARWELVKRLFEAARGRPAADRAAFIQSECADADLRREVESLLAAHAEAGSFAERPPVAMANSCLNEAGVPSDRMRLHPGERVGVYEIQEFLAGGAMGDVYRARDLQLQRAVALKVLPASFSTDRDRVARFEREARLLAALNHPSIATIHGIADAEVPGLSEAGQHVRALVMELVDGETLADRVTRGPVPVTEALSLARQIAQALEAAHAKGIIHRDLKPANVKVTPDGTVKVLDFGLAKAFSGDKLGLDLSELPALTVNQTHEGLIAGTPAYMSPEQARGQAVDKRTDIFAFGCVFYEMLTAKPAFPGDTMFDRIAAVLHHEPQWDALPRAVPPAIRTLLRRCVAKDRRQRLSDATAVRLEIEDAQSAPANELRAAPSPRPNWRWPAVAASAVALTASVAVGLAVWFMPRPAPTVSRFVIPLGTGDVFVYPGRHLVSFSPDGRHVVYQANQGLYLRRLDQLQARLIPGTEQGGGRSPVFSADGETVGFWAAGELRRIGLNGGVPVTLCKAENPWGVSWEADGSILFGQGPKGIWRVADTGGTPELLISIEAGAEAHGPQLLPGGEWVLFTLRGKGVASWDAAQIVAQSLETAERKVLIARGRDARYVATGHLVYGDEGVLLAVPFDVDEVRVTGGPVSLVKGVGDATSITGAVHFSVARNGSLVYTPGTVGVTANRVLVWVDRQGREDPINAPPDGYLYPRLSPNGMRVAIDVTGPTNRDVWIWDFARQTRTRFTFDAAADWYPVWTPDGRKVLWGSQSAGAYNLFWQSADGTGAVERLTQSPITQAPYAFSPDGKRLLLREEESGFAETLSLLALDGDRRITQLIRTTFNYRNGEISQDGRWLAYESDESGRQEIYVRPFPDIDRGRWQVSSAGGQRPAWARSGQELFYQDLDGALLLVPVAVEGERFSASSPIRLVESGYFTGDGTTSGRTYDVSPDGRRFLMIKNAPAPPHFVVVLNWTEELKRLVPTN